LYICFRLIYILVAEGTAVPLYVKQMVSVTHGFLSHCAEHSKPSELRGIGDGLIVRVAVISITGLVLTKNKASDW
jgi:hypothetical protein